MKKKLTGRELVLSKMSHRVSAAIARELEHNKLSVEEGVSVLSLGVCEVLDTIADISDKDYKRFRQHFCEHVINNPEY